jgi:hypothetical protein
MTFTELTRNCSQEERNDLAWFLAMFRLRQTWEGLRALDPQALLASRAQNEQGEQEQP